MKPLIRSALKSPMRAQRSRLNAHYPTRNRVLELEREELSRLISKSLWRERQKRTFSFFCPSCRAPRKISIPRHPLSPEVLFRLGVAAAFFTLITWPVFGWKGVVSFVPFAALYEMIHRLRVRTRLKCDQCGFDPYLYAVDVQLAREEIEAYWRAKFKDAGIPYPGDPEDAAQVEGAVLTHSDAAPHEEVEEEAGTV